jgi:hypothetical protein
LAPRKEPVSDAKLFYPQVGFKDDVEAVGVTLLASKLIEKAHDDFWKQVKISNDIKW